MSISYDYEVIKVDQAAGVMEVVYTSPGRQTMHIGARLPYEGESLEAVIEMYSPVAYWQEREMVRQSVAVGTKGARSLAAPADSRTPLQKAKDEKLAEIAAWRFQQETAGVLVGNNRVATDRQSQAMITGAFVSLSQGLVQTVDFKMANGRWVKLTAAQIAPIAQAVSAHVQAAFGAERSLAERVESAATVQAVEAIKLPQAVI